MSPERWSEIEALFQSAIDLSPAERTAFLDKECRSDLELRAEVEKLLRNSALAGTFIESPVWTDSSFLDTSVKKALSDSLEPNGGPGDGGDLSGLVVGPYRLVDEIGRGGMGTVYRAERADGEFSQVVAVKLIKRGMDSDFIIRRFRHERQILASFEHPFIARLLDGGTTREGVPYFVMEYIAGKSIYDWCDSRRLDTASRLKLFLKVCSAIEYAHERKVVHRDIKPSNILIDRSGAPKLLDFGIAKILDPDLIHESVNPTASMMRMMTPDYASPEQVQGGEITSASDIYSLGVLLYELISGHRPYALSGRSLQEVTRMIAEVAPGPPSRALKDPGRLLSRYSGDEVEAASVRNAAAEELSELFERGLDDVVLQAMGKIPAERYGSVRELADDINRFLNGDRVHARPIARAPKRTAGHERRSATKKALAVLPLRFITFGPDADTDDRFLGIGLADALISRLSRTRLFEIRPTSSILSFGEGALNPIAAGRELQVDFILDGSIKKAGHRLRVSVQLLDVEENAAVWATAIDENIGDIFALEDTLANKLIEVLLPQLTSGEVREYSRRGTNSPEAFEHYLRGRFYFNTFTEDGLAKAFLSFHEAVAADPAYAHAYAGIADYYNWLGMMGVLPPQECFQPAIQAATRGISLDPNLSEAHASLGFSLHAGNFDWLTAEKHLRRAIDLNPSNANAHVWLSIVLFTDAQFDAGLEFARKAVELDPLAPFNHHNIGWGLYFARRYDEAEAQYRKVVTDFPEYSFGFYGLSKVHRAAGETRLAIEENSRALELMDGSVFARLSQAECLAADGQRDAALKMLGELAELSKERYISPYQLSLTYCRLGDPDAALEQLQKAAEIRDAWLNWALVEPVFDSISGDARFSAILRTIEHPGLGKERVGASNGRKDPITIAGRLAATDNLTTLVMDSKEVAANGSSVDDGRHRTWGRLAIGAVSAIAIAALAWSIFLTFSRPQSTVTPVAATQSRSIVVLPFRSFDGNESMGIGVADALTNKLGLVKSLEVIASNSGRSVAAADPAAIGAELKAAFVLRGTIVREEAVTRINAEMLETRSSSVVWSADFKSMDSNLFALETQIVERVLKELKIEPLPFERQQIGKYVTQSGAAYELYLSGRHLLTNRSPDSLRRAVEIFTRATREDPGFTLAYIGLADAYSLLMVHDVDPPADAVQKANEAVLKALAIDDDCPQAHASLGYLKFYYERDWAGAELEFRRAVQLNPSYAQAHHWFSVALSAMDRPLEGVSEAKLAERLDPRSLAVRSAVAMALFYNRQYAESVNACDSVLAEDPAFLPALKVKRWVFAAIGDLQAARDTLEREFRAGGGRPSDKGWKVIETQLLSDRSDRSELLRQIDELASSAEIGGNPYAFAYEVALAYLAAGDAERAIDWLQRAEAARSHSFNFVLVDPRLDKLRGNPRFAAVAAAVPR